MWAGKGGDKDNAESEGSQESNPKVAAQGRGNWGEEERSSSTRILKKAKIDKLDQECAVLNQNVHESNRSPLSDVVVLGRQNDETSSHVWLATATSIQDKSKKTKKIPSSASETTPLRKSERKGTPSKPKRPLSAYNFFFKDERASITEVLSRSKTKEELKEALESFGAQDLVLKHEQEDSVSETEPPDKKKMFNGIVSFQDIGKIIGRRWRSISEESFARYSALADTDSTRYQAEMEKYYRDCSREIHLQRNTSPPETNLANEGMCSVDHQRQPYGSYEYEQGNRFPTTSSSSLVVNPTREELLRRSVMENLHLTVLSNTDPLQAHEIRSLLTSELGLSMPMRRTQPNPPNFEGMGSVDRQREPHGSFVNEQGHRFPATSASSIVVNPISEALLRRLVIESLRPTVLNNAYAPQAHEIRSLLDSELGLSRLMHRPHQNLPHFALGGLSNLASSYVSPLGGNAYSNSSSDYFGSRSNNNNTSQLLVENGAIFLPHQQLLASELLASPQEYGSQLSGHIALNQPLGRGDLPRSQQLLAQPAIMAPQSRHSYLYNPIVGLAPALPDAAPAEAPELDPFLLRQFLQQQPTMQGLSTEDLQLVFSNPNRFTSSRNATNRHNFS